jgi:hypothetical protein
VQKISRIEERAAILNELGDIMYGRSDVTKCSQARSSLQNGPGGKFCMICLNRVHLLHDKSSEASHLPQRPKQRLQDFVDGEQSHRTYLCKFVKEITKRNPLGSLQRP